MIRFNFSVLSNADDISTFELGDIEIVYGDEVISSRDKSPSQSMMIFLAMSDLLDCVCSLVSHSTRAEIAFVGADSSFKLVFKKHKQDIIIRHKEGLVSAREYEVLEAVYAGVNTLYSLYADMLESRNNYFDLKNSLVNFKKKCLHKM